MKKTFLGIVLTIALAGCGSEGTQLSGDKNPSNREVQFAAEALSMYRLTTTGFGKGEFVVNEKNMTYFSKKKILPKSYLKHFESLFRYAGTLKSLVKTRGHEQLFKGTDIDEAVKFFQKHGKSLAGFEIVARETQIYLNDIPVPETYEIKFYAKKEGKESLIFEKYINDSHQYIDAMALRKLINETMDMDEIHEATNRRNINRMYTYLDTIEAQKNAKRNGN